jgi:hypothetical protein
MLHSSVCTYSKGAPKSQCGGDVLEFQVKWSVLVLWLKGHHRMSYFVSKLVTASTIYCPLKLMNLWYWHIYGRECCGSISSFFTEIVTLTSEIVAPTFVLTKIKLHVIDILRIVKRALLFVTEKGTANGDPKEGGPGEKIGSVGQGGPPHNWYIDATNPKLVTISVPTTHFTTRNERRCNPGNSTNVWRCGGNPVADCLRFTGLVFGGFFIGLGLV